MIEPEKREYRRFSLVMPADVRGPKRSRKSFEAVTRDISGAGVYLLLPEELRLGSRREWRIVLPPELCGGRRVEVRCRGKVVRAERLAGQGHVGVAARAQHYQFVTSQNGSRRGRGHRGAATRSWLA